MNEIFERGDGTPTIDVRIFRHGALVHQELCESEEAALVVVNEWAELDGVECVVDDLSVHHVPGDILEPVPADIVEEDYPRSV